MKRLAAFLILVCLSFGVAAPSYAKDHNKYKPINKASRKAEKKQEKLQKKYAKKQRKMENKMVRNQDKHSKYKPLKQKHN